MAESFSNRLNVAMAFRNVKQIDFVHAAEKFNIKLGKSHMSQYVSGKTVPRADIAHFLAAFLQVNEDWLMGKDVPMEQNVATLPAIKSDEAQHDSNPASAQSTEGKTMRTFTKSHKLDNVLYDVRGPVADEAARMEAAGTHILKLNIGNPAPFGFRTPDEVVYDMAQQLPETEGYSPSKGLFSARKAIMQYAQLKNIPNVSIDDIFTGNGVSELINLSLSALLDDGDEVLVPSPDITSVMRDPNGIPISTISALKSRIRPRQLSSSIQIIRPERFIQRNCCNKSSTLPENISSLFSPMRFTIVWSWMDWSIFLSHRWLRTCSV